MANREKAKVPIVWVPLPANSDYGRLQNLSYEWPQVWYRSVQRKLLDSIHAWLCEIKATSMDRKRKKVADTRYTLPYL